MPAAGPNAPLALAALAALVACEWQDLSAVDVRERAAAERREGRRDIADARMQAQRELAQAKVGADDAGAGGWIHSGPSGGTPTPDPAAERQVAAHGELLVQTEQAEAAYEVARHICDAQADRTRDGCLHRAEHERQSRIEQAQSHDRQAMAPGDAMP